MFEAVLEAIRQYDTIVIHRHSNPDGDALGSQIGLKHLILDNFPGKRVYMVGDGAGRYSFMADCAMNAVPDAVYADALAVILDTSARAMISDGRYTLAKETARIDHHLFVERIARIEVMDSTFESCCGLIAAFAVEASLRLSKLTATSLYTGMVTDSGRFRYDATNARTFRLASVLMEHGIDTGALYGSLYASELRQLKLRARFVERIALTANRVAYIYTDKALARELGEDITAISRGMVGVMSDIRGVDIRANFTETDMGVLCELRSSKYNINPIAVKYGGGGHARASGATLKNRAEAMRMLSELDALAGKGQYI